MKPVFYVIDTSYLLEIAACGRDSDPRASATIRRRLEKTRKAGGRFFVPLPCLFELGDHIAQVKDDRRRSRLAEWLLTTVESSLESQTPWQITPTGDPKTILPPLMARFVDAAKRKIGLVDTFAEMEARRLKQDFDKLKVVVHIWTNDRALKAREPDPEADPFLW